MTHEGGWELFNVHKTDNPSDSVQSNKFGYQNAVHQKYQFYNENDGNLPGYLVRWSEDVVAE